MDSDFGAVLSSLWDLFYLFPKLAGVAGISIFDFGRSTQFCRS